MSRYFIWTTVPAIFVTAALEQWLGGYGIFVAIILFVVGWVLWINLIDKE